MTQKILGALVAGLLLSGSASPAWAANKEHQQLISKLSAGDEVVTNGGMLGKITEDGESFVTLEIADGVRIKVQKFQVSALMPKGTLKSA